MTPFYRYIVLDNNKYVVAADTYIMKWSRAFSSQLAGNIVRLNFIDKGPGIRVYDATLILKTWDPTSQPYLDGITQPWNVQMQNLENSYANVVGKPIQFQDPLGRTPGPTANYGVYFTNYDLTVPKYSTPQTPVMLANIEVTEATQLVNP